MLDLQPTSGKLNPQELHRYALLVGVVSIVLALLIALASYFIAMSSVNFSIHNAYLNKSRMLVTAAADEGLRTEENLLAHVQALWGSSLNRPDDEYICITDSDANLLLHSAHPDTVGKCAGANLLLSESEDSPSNLQALIDIKSDYVGDYISSAGEEQIAAFSYLPERDWVIGIHRSKSALDSQIRNMALPFIAGFSGVILLLIPISLLLNYKAFMGTIEEVEQAKKSVAVSENLLRSHVTNTPIGVIQWNLDFEIESWNPAAEKIFGYCAEEAIGCNAADLLVTDDQKQSVKKIWEELRAQTGGFHSINENVTKDQSIIICEWNNSSLVTEDGVIYAVAGMVTDVTESKQAEEALRASERKYKSLFDNIQSGFALQEAVFDENGTPVDYVFLDVNSAFEELTSLDRADLIGKRATDVLPGIENDPADWIGKVGSVAQTEVSLSFENYSEPLGRWYSVVAYSPVKGQTAVLFHEITKRKHLEAQLRQTQKMEAIGTLAGGIAHDFNNLLFAILGYADLALDDLPKSSPVRKHIDEITTAGHRAAGLVKQILTFARRANKDIEPIQVSLIAKEASQMLQATLPSTIEVTLRLNTSNTTIIADPTEIHQVIMNLCTNAGQAMMESGGSLEIGLDETEIDAAATGQLTSLHAGPHLVLSVVDTGPGIPPDVIGNIFEPFYTTKEVGEGTGLGLAVVHGIINSLGGAVSIESEVGNGAVFKVYLPMEKTETREKEVAKSEIPRGTETILVVDDEPAIAKMISESLHGLGYNVVTFNDSQIALKAFIENPQQFDLVITDQTMPRLTGAQLAREILIKHPKQPIILCTGYSQTMPPGKAFEVGITAYLRKPVPKVDLGNCVRQVLDRNVNKV